MKCYFNELFTLSLCFVSALHGQSIEIRNLSLDQKIGQLFMVAAVADEDIARDFIRNKAYRLDKEYIAKLIIHYHIGGILYLGPSDREKQKNRTNYFQSLSTLPLLIGQDLEPGRVGGSRLPLFYDFPSNQQLGNYDDEEYTYKTALTIGQSCKDVGVHINFAPVADINNNPDNPVINDRAFSDDPETVARHAIAFARGLADSGVIACAKHFPGHGDTDSDSHYCLPKINHDAKRLHAVELYPFKKLIAVNIPTIMVAHLEVSAFEPQKNLPSSLSKNIVTTLLRQELGYKGLIITDGLDMQGVARFYTAGQAELCALLAGNDMLLAPVDVPAAVAVIKQAVINGLLSEEEIDTHVARILHLKKSLKLW